MSTYAFAFRSMAARHYNNVLALSLFTVCLFASTANADYDHGHNHKVTQNWLNHGGDLRNRRYAKYETKISLETVSKLRFKWEFNAGQDISVTPSIHDGKLYFPSWNGHLYSLKVSDGSVVWENNLGILTGLNWTGFITPNWIVSRSTPTIAGDNDELLIVGIYGPAVLVALERSTGKLVWSVRLDSHAAGAITMSPTYYKGSIYIGTTSVEEGFSPDECCTFRGSFSKLDVKTGAVLWQTYMLPDNHGKLGQYSGAAIWGSSPSIDAHRRHVYIATGNTYSVPEYISQCQENQLNTTNSSVPTHSDACVEPGNHGNSILALDMDTGEIQWYRQLGGYDVWFLECFLNTSVCPVGPNDDADFGEAPMMLRPYINGTKRDVVVAVQKSGFAWALDRNNGSLVWSTEVGPGGILGGGSWGAATDKKRVYTNIINNGGKNFTLKPSNNVTTSGGWAAMDPRSGEVLWSTANPSNAFSAGPVSVANGVLFGGSTDANGTVYAMNTRTGEILWSYETGATVYGGMSISNGCIYVGSGYKVGFGATMPMFTAGTSLFAFCVT